MCRNPVIGSWCPTPSIISPATACSRVAVLRLGLQTVVHRALKACYGAGGRQGLQWWRSQCLSPCSDLKSRRAIIALHRSLLYCWWRLEHVFSASWGCSTVNEVKFVSILSICLLSDHLDFRCQRKGLCPVRFDVCYYRL